MDTTTKEKFAQAVRSAILDEVSEAATRIAEKVAAEIELPDADGVNKERVEELIGATENVHAELREQLENVQSAIEQVTGAVSDLEYLDVDTSDLDMCDMDELREAAGIV